MTRDEFERRIEIRLQNCEDALSQHPDSAAWLGRYHELCEIAHMVQQLGPEVVEEQPKLGAGILKKAAKLLQDEPADKKMGLTFDQCMAKAGYRTNAQDAPGSPVAAPGPDPAQAQVDPEKASQSATQAQRKPEMGRLVLRRKVLQLIEEGPKSYLDLEIETGQGPDALQAALRILGNSQKIEEYKPSLYRIKDMRPVVRKRQQEDKLRGQGRKTRTAYTDPPDGSTARSWSTQLRKHIMLYLKGHPNGATEFELQAHLADQVGISDKVTAQHVRDQLENLAKRQVVLREMEIHHADGVGNLWKAAHP